MNIAIYQINMERDTNRIAFMSYENLERFQHSPNVDCKIYDKVFEGDIDCNNLESIYRKFNLDYPADYVGRSLSVSDVVEVKDSDSIAPGFYFCDDFGFKEVQFDKTLCPEIERKPITDKISVLLIQPDKRPKMVEINSDLEAMQAVVGGDIEEYMPFEDDAAIICNEEGKMTGLPLNRAIYNGQTHEMLDIVAGDFFIVYAPIESEKFLSLPKEMADKYANMFKNPERFFRTDNGIKAIPVSPTKDKER